MPPLQRLIPLVHVGSVPRSISFYEKLGFVLVNSQTSPAFGDEAHWAYLRSGGADLMLALATAPVRPEEQAVLFYIHAPDVEALHGELQAQDLSVGEITRPEHMPAGEFRVEDPDGYVLLVGQPTRSDLS